MNQSINLKEKVILDACCGGRTFWFQKKYRQALFIDKRTFPKSVIWKRGRDERKFEVKPDVVMDFRKLDLPTGHFSLVVFDPPHLSKRNGKTGYIHKKYGSLDKLTWRDDIRAGFSECFRVLKKNGILIFKWSESEFKLKEVIALSPIAPLFGHPSGKFMKTHWLAFIKP